MTGRSIDKEFAEEVLKDLVSATPQGLLIDFIQREVATYFDIKLHDLKGPKRLQSVARPRMIAMYLSRKLTGSSFPEIGSRFGGKDHSTVISAVKKIERLVAEDSNLRSVVGTIEGHLRQCLALASLPSVPTHVACVGSVEPAPNPRRRLPRDARSV